MFIIKTEIYSVFTLALVKLTFLLVVYGIYLMAVYIRDILLISMTVRPEWRVFGRYLKSAFLIPDLGPIKLFLSSANFRDKEGSWGIIHIPKNSECRIIRSERVKKLQSSIIAKLLDSWFGIVCSSDDLKVLASYGNSGWLTRNLLTASGAKRKSAVAIKGESRRRIQTVYRPFVSSLSLYLKLEDGIRNGWAETPETGITGKIGRLFKRSSTNGVVTKNMYPSSIEIQILKIKRENILYYKLEAVRKIKTNSEYMGFEKYLKAQSLITEGRIQNREKVEMLMNKLESLH
ncbi:MAG: hypothetical protein PF693_00685 [Spirochaetia bacterium]|jgi:hypothetical protein|nr:hypothetical protein [Spirochaetia bacterium]